MDRHTQIRHTTEILAARVVCGQIIDHHALRRIAFTGDIQGNLKGFQEKACSMDRCD